MASDSSKRLRRSLASAAASQEGRPEGKRKLPADLPTLGEFMKKSNPRAEITPPRPKHIWAVISAAWTLALEAVGGVGMPLVSGAGLCNASACAGAGGSSSDTNASSTADVDMPACSKDVCPYELMVAVK